MDKINIEVILASHAQNVPQVGFPQIEPVTNATILNTNPDGAILLAIIEKFLFLKIKFPIDKNPIKEKIDGLGIDTQEVDGHNIDELISALSTSDASQTFNCIIANTTKGKGSSVMENKKNWHYWNPMTKEEIKITREELK